MKSVRQYKSGAADVLIVEEVEVPAIQQGEVLIQGLYTSVNYADIKTRMGNKGQSTFPITLGLDIVG
ncbi:MAG: quinone oxidoreductase, partial [Solibacillus isronensis]